MFITVKVKWWRVLSFVLLVIIVVCGLLYLKNGAAESNFSGTGDLREGQIWQV